MRHVNPGETVVVAQGGAASATPPPPPVTAPATTGGPATGAATPFAGLSVRELRATRDELSRQLSNVASRREDLAGQLRAAAPGVDKAGLESRIATLDARIVAMETDLATTGRLLQVAQGANAGTTVPPPLPAGDPSGGQITAMSIVFFLAVLMPLSLAWGRAILRRSGKGAEQPSREVLARLDRMEEGIEAIAIEVERVSEGQRFITKVLGQGAAEPVALPRGEKVRVERES